MIDYAIFYKQMLPLAEDWPPDAEWDLFISAFNSSRRVGQTYDKARAAEKHWLILPDYEYTQREHPTGRVFAPSGTREGECIRAYMGDYGKPLAGKSLCIDITDFIKPYMMFLLRWLKEKNIKQCDVPYSEPDYYEKKEKTRFSDEAVTEVRQVEGFEGVHGPNVSNDLLILGAGYDHELIAHAAENKNHARKVQLFGLPSLRAHMYQENVLRAHRASEAVGVGAEDDLHSYFAPANDPFVTANVLQEIVASAEARSALTNLYLCPLATKPQSLGFTVYYLSECIGKPVSMIYPFCRSHSRETSKGISRIWRYTIEL